MGRNTLAGQLHGLDRMDLGNGEDECLRYAV